MFQISRPPTTRIVLALAAAAALVAGPIASTSAMPIPDPTTLPSQVTWQDTANEIAAEVRGARSLAACQMLHNELTLLVHSHYNW